MSRFFKGLRAGGRRRLAVALFGGAALVWLVLQVFPRGGRGSYLELLALGGDGQFSESVSIPGHWALTDGLDAGSTIRVPLILAIRNTGREDSPPARLELTVPTRYRMVRSNGQPIPAEYMPGTPMARYEMTVPAIGGSSGSIAGYLPVLDTIWLEPIIPPYYCIALSDSVPDFVPAPPAPVEAIAQVRIFYSFSAEEMKQRQTGLLSVQLDPDLLEQEVQAAPPVFQTIYSRPRAPFPNISALTYVGSRRARCGDPQDPMEILTTLWETPEGGRFFVLDYGGAPRKYLFDLDRDSIIELEMWDGTGSGQFDARRQARLPIPGFLIPERAPVPVYAFGGEVPTEDLYALDRFARARTSPYRFKTQPKPEKPRTNRYRPGVIASADTTGGGYTIRYWRDPGAASAAPETPHGAPIVTDARRGAPPTATQPPPTPGARPARPAVPSTPQPLGRPLTPDPSPARPAPPVPRPDPTPRPVEPSPPPPSPDRPVVERERSDPKPSESVPSERPAEQPPREPKVLGRPLDSVPPAPPPE